jgi:hypothetical protein
VRRIWKRRETRLTSAVLLLTLLVGCRVSLSPVKNRVAVGVESYVVFDADGENGEGDLYIGAASGGTAFRITFTRVHEAAPALSPDGIMLAFIRGSHAADSAGYRIWVMNLLNGSEREIPAFGPGAYPRRLGWSLDGTSLFVRTSRGDVRVAAPPADPESHAVSQIDKARADTLLSVPLGFPVVGVAADCDSGICAFTPSGSQVLTGTGRGAFRWGADSVAYFKGDEIEVRPLGGGTTRQIRWSGVPGHPRTATQFPGVGPTDQDR